MRISTIISLVSALLLLLLCSCPGPNNTYQKGTFPDTATSLSGANSEYDDFNSMTPPGIVDYIFPLFFSSNRSTLGGTFDIENYKVDIQLNESSGAVTLRAYASADSNPWQNMNSASNEFGPYYITDSYGIITLYMFASDRNGNLDIFHGWPGMVHESIALNSGSDDAYPSLGPNNTFYFSSNRNGNFHIFSATVPSGQALENFLQTPGATIVSVDAVNSTGDDKAPYVNGNLMVFASNRSGGHGGYDLYYSIYGSGGWSQPVNFGPRINTSSDEFRPVVVVSDGALFTNNLMIFSSNRPGGMGGFDLYYVGISKSLQ